MNLERAALMLMPMHLHVDAAGRVLSAGSTLQRMVGPVRDFDAAFEAVGPVAGASLAQLAAAERVFLRNRADPGQVLRGGRSRWRTAGWSSTSGWGSGWSRRSATTS